MGIEKCDLKTALPSTTISIGHTNSGGSDGIVITVVVPVGRTNASRKKRDGIMVCGVLSCECERERKSLGAKRENESGYKLE